MSREFTHSSNHRPGEPLRAWSLSDEFALIDLRLLLQSTDSACAVSRLIGFSVSRHEQGQDSTAPDDFRMFRTSELSRDDIVALAELNSMSVSQWREPPTTMAEGWVFVGSVVADLFHSIEKSE